MWRGAAERGERLGEYQSNSKSENVPRPTLRSTRMRIQASSRFEEVQSAPPKPHPPSRRPFAARSRRLILWLAVDRRASLPEGTHPRLFASFGSAWVSTDGPCAGRPDGWGSIGPTAIDWPGVDQSRAWGVGKGGYPSPSITNGSERTQRTHLPRFHPFSTDTGSLSTFFKGTMTQIDVPACLKPK